MLATLLSLLVVALPTQAQSPETPQLTYLEIQRAHASTVLDVAISPDDRWLVTSDSVETKIWDLQSGRVLRRYEALGTYKAGSLAHTFSWPQRNALALSAMQGVILLDPKTLEERERLEISAGDALFLDDTGSRLFRASGWGDSTIPGWLEVRELRFGKRGRGEESSAVVLSTVDAFPDGARGGGDLVALGGNRFLASSTQGTHHRLLRLEEWMELGDHVALGTGRTARGSDGNLYLLSVEGTGPQTQGRVKRLSAEDFRVLGEGTFALADGAHELAPRSRDFLDRSGKLLLRTRKELVDVDLATLALVSARPHGLGEGVALESSAVAHALDIWVGTSAGRVFVVRGSSPYSCIFR